MTIKRLSWSGKRKNHLVNFYALEPYGKGQVDILTPQFAWGSNDDAIAQINLGRAKSGVEPYHGKVLHVVLDMSSGRLYLPNGESKRIINDDPALLTMYDSVRLKAEQLIDTLPMAPPIPGDPIDTIRIRRIGDFASVAEFIKRQSKNPKQYEKDVAVAVIEADLSRMPKTTTEVFGGKPERARSDKWTFVGKGKPVDFMMTSGMGDNREVVVHQQKTPFILINIDPEAHVSNADKERFVVTGYREYAAQDRPDDPTSSASPQLQSFKYLMYIGWSFRELSLFILTEDVHDFGDLMHKAAYIYNAAKSLKVDGYPDPASNPYYYSFQIGEDFPVVFRPQAMVDIYDYSQHPEMFQVVFFDPKTSYVTFKTPIFIPEGVAKNVFKPKSQIFVTQYDPTDKVIKTNAPAQDFLSASRASFKAMVTDVAHISGRKVGTIPVRDRYLNELVFERKHITDYPQAADVIRDLCVKLSANPDKEAGATPETIRFDDLEVVVGPWKRVAGFLGGYVDARRMQQQAGKKSMELVPNFWVFPPVIAIDNVQCPSVGDRTHVIIHEYRHHINAQLWVKSGVTSSDVMDSGEETNEQRTEKMTKYLRDPNEFLAHKTQFKYLLAIGMSKEQILRQMLGNRKPGISDIPVVKEYLRIINEAASEMNLEKVERESTEKAMADLAKREQEVPAGLIDVGFFDPDAPLDI